MNLIGVALQPAGDHCFISFWSDYPLAILANASVIFAILVAFGIMTYVYSALVQMYIKAMRRQADELGNETHILSDNEKKLIIKSVAVCGAFSLAWYEKFCN